HFWLAHPRTIICGTSISSSLTAYSNPPDPAPGPVTCHTPTTRDRDAAMAALRDRGDAAIKLFGRTIPLLDAAAEVALQLRLPLPRGHRLIATSVLQEPFLLLLFFKLFFILLLPFCLMRV
uniref:Uncharacterized protein n=1 Tax=Aegilops tauschii subsp. strangulata TaxID=200361 RepID=A0A453ER21_AEGTS